MQSKLLTYIRGYVEVEAEGERTEQLINAIYLNQHAIWQVRRTGPRQIRFLTDLTTYFALRPLMRQTGCKLRVGRRGGLPFLFRRLESRILFFAGFALFMLAIYLMSQLIWSVHIVGNNTIAYNLIESSAEKAGIRTWRWKFKLDEPQVLSRKLTESLPGAAWVGVEIKGTKVEIRIVEQTIPESRKLMNPRHLVSAYDAVVSKISVSAGRPAVRINTRVKKGELLVSGLIGPPENSNAVVAKGSVRGIVWHEYNIVSPMKQLHKVYTGQDRTRRYVVIGNRALQISGYGKLPFDAFETIADRKSVAWRKWQLPFGYIHEQVKEVQIATEPIEKDAARRIGLTQAKGDLLHKSGESATITGEKILHEKIEGGKVYMKVLFEVEQEIAVELPIIQGE